jgi:hypothetical protein
MDGADTSTTFIDENGRLWTAGGNAQLKTDAFKFGNASCYFDGTNSYATTPTTTDFDFGSGAFTVDFWSKYNGKAAGTLWSLGGVSGSKFPNILISHSSTTNVTLLIYTSSALQVNITKTDITLNAWNHIAAIRSGNNFYLAVNGVLSSATSWSGTVDYDNTVPLRLGHQQADTVWYKGWLDEIRVSKGIARWTSNFTPPIAPYAPYGKQFQSSGWWF